jgi:hypothetical protein
MAQQGLTFEPRPARPAQVERRRILLAAFRADDRGARHGGAKVFVDEGAGARGVGGILDPELGKRRVDGKLAGEARGVRVEDARANAPIREQICEEVCLRQIRRGEDAFQNRYDSMPVTPSSEIPERPETLKYATLTPMRSVTIPRMPTEPVMNELSYEMAGTS